MYYTENVKLHIFWKDLCWCQFEKPCRQDALVLVLERIKVKGQHFEEARDVFLFLFYLNNCCIIATQWHTIRIIDTICSECRFMSFWFGLSNPAKPGLSLIKSTGMQGHFRWELHRRNNHF